MTKHPFRKTLSRSKHFKDLCAVCGRAEAYPIHSLPGYNDLKEQLDKAPETWLPGLLLHAAQLCVNKPVFKSPEMMFKFLKRSLLDPQNED